MRIIPAIDIIDGKCVRLTQGDYGRKTTYNDDPLEVAKGFEAAGLSHLHLVDLDGARSQKIVNHKVLEQIAGGTSLQVDFGGGLKSSADVKTAFECGARQVTAGSVAAKNPGLFRQWLKDYGPEKIILGADSREGKIAVDGWEASTDQLVSSFIRDYATEGVQYVIATDISKDGMLAGPALELYQQILQENPALKLIASGGISSIEDLKALQRIGCEGAIVGKAIYEGRISLQELQELC